MKTIISWSLSFSRFVETRAIAQEVTDFPQLLYFQIKKIKEQKGATYIKFLISVDTKCPALADFS